MTIACVLELPIRDEVSSPHTLSVPASVSHGKPTGRDVTPMVSAEVIDYKSGGRGPAKGPVGTLSRPYYLAK